MTTPLARKCDQRARSKAVEQSEPDDHSHDRCHAAIGVGPFDVVNTA
jgi:hypothetical protein